MFIFYLMNYMPRFGFKHIAEQGKQNSKGLKSRHQLNEVVVNETRSQALECM